MTIIAMCPICQDDSGAHVPAIGRCIVCKDTICATHHTDGICSRCGGSTVHHDFSKEKPVAKPAQRRVSDSETPLGKAVKASHNPSPSKRTRWSA